MLFAEPSSYYSEEFRPVFQSENTAFYLTLWNMNYHQGSKVGGNNGGKVGGEQGVDWEKRKTLVIEAIKEDSGIRTVSLADKTGLSRRQVERTMDQLKNEGRLAREGSSRNGNWFIMIYN